MRNVAGDPAYAAARARLEERLLGELRRTGDPRLVDNGSYFGNPPLAGPPEDFNGRTPAELRRGPITN